MVQFNRRLKTDVSCINPVSADTGDPSYGSVVQTWNFSAASATAATAIFSTAAAVAVAASATTAYSRFWGRSKNGCWVPGKRRNRKRNWRIESS